VVASILRRLTQRNSKRLPLVEQRDQVFQIAAEAIQAPADDHIDPDGVSGRG
jgi:hypothetical protein